MANDDVSPLIKLFHGIGIFEVLDLNRKLIPYLPLTPANLHPNITNTQPLQPPHNLTHQQLIKQLVKLSCTNRDKEFLIVHIYYILYIICYMLYLYIYIFIYLYIYVFIYQYIV